MSNETNAQDDDKEEKIKVGDIYINHSLHEEIQNSSFDDMPMTYLSAMAQLGSSDAQRLMRHLGESDPTWVEAIPNLKP